MSNVPSSDYFVLAMLMFLPTEFYLMYVNYLARVKYKEYLRETSKLWLKFDKRGLTTPSLILHFAITTTAMVFLAFYPPLQFFAGIGCGVTILNAIIDDRTLKKQLSCIETKCENLNVKKNCLDCVIPTEYDVSLFPRVRIRKKKK